MLELGARKKLPSRLGNEDDKLFSTCSRNWFRMDSGAGPVARYGCLGRMQWPFRSTPGMNGAASR